MISRSQLRGRGDKESEATANLGAVLTGSTLVTMFVVRKLGLTLAELDDVTSGTTTAAEAKARVSAFGGAPTTDAPATAGQSEATAHLGAVLTGYDLLAMFVVRKLGLSLGKLDDVTSETKSVQEVKAEVNVFASQTDPQTVTQ
ncbi:hypothetical protein ABBQ38_005474 [Trebouxia sp. C0009 RCD-2024]